MRKQNKIAIVIACALVAALGWSGQVKMSTAVARRIGLVLYQKSREDDSL